MGAWIETLNIGVENNSQEVAPRVGAWIETQEYVGLFRVFASSHPVWVRGLKPDIEAVILFYSVVAPRVGAWIET